MGSLIRTTAEGIVNTAGEPVFRTSSPRSASTCPARAATPAADVIIDFERRDLRCRCRRRRAHGCRTRFRHHGLYARAGGSPARAGSERPCYALGQLLYRYRRLCHPVAQATRGNAGFRLRNRRDAP